MVGVQRRDHQNVRRRLRVQITERHHILVAQHLVRRDFLPHDLAEETIGDRHDPDGAWTRAKWYEVFGLGTKPLIVDFITSGTVVWTSETAGTWSCTIAFACW